jgi:hypothetical protein
MTKQAITPLRRRMIEDMTIRRLAPGTQAQYLSVVAKFARHFGRSPDQLGYEEVRAYQLQLAQSGLDAGGINHATTALRHSEHDRERWPQRAPVARTAAARLPLP